MHIDKTKARVAVFFICAILCYLFIALNASLVFLRTDYTSEISGTYSIAKGEVYTDEIEANGKYLKKIDIGFSLFERANTYTVRVRLLENDRAFYDTVLPSSDINDYYTVELFSAKKLDTSNTYMIELTNVTEGNDNPVMINLTSNGSDKESSICKRNTYEDVAATNILRVICFILVAAVTAFIYIKKDVKNFPIGKMAAVSLAIILVTFILGFDLFDRIEPCYNLHIYQSGAVPDEIAPGEIKEYPFGFGGSGFDSFAFIGEWEGNLDLYVKIFNTETNEIIWEGERNDTNVILPDNYGVPSVYVDMGKLAKKGFYTIAVENRQTSPLTTYIFEDGSLNLNIYRSSNVTRELGLLITFVLAAYIFAIVMYKEKIFKSLPAFFLATAIPFGLIYMLLFTPSTIPDNHNHFPAVYRFTNILTGHGGSTEFFYRAEDLDLFDGVDSKENGAFQYSEYSGRTSFFEQGHDLVDNPELHRDFMKYYSIVGYLPQVIGITIGRILRLGGMITIYLGRLCMLAFSIFASLNAIRKTPVGKSLFMLVSLLPITLMMMSGFSYDAMLFSASISYTACILALKKDGGNKKLLIEMLIWAFVLGAVKGGGGLLILPLIILLFDKENKKASLIKMGEIAGCSIVSVIFFNKIMQIGRTLFQFGEEGNEFLSTAYALRHPVRYLRLLFTTYLSDFSDMTGGMLGSYLGWLEYMIPIVLLLAMVAVIGLYAMLEKDELKLQNKDKFILMIPVFCGLFITPMMLLSATYVGWPSIQGVQGRYFLSLFIPVLLVITKFSLRIADGYRQDDIQKIQNKCLMFMSIFSAIAVYYIERTFLVR